MEIFVASPIIARRREYPGTRPLKSIPTRSHQNGYFENTNRDYAWNKILHGFVTYSVDSALSSSEDNPFAAPKQQPTGNISVNLPTDDWLCRKMDRLNMTIVQGYPSRSSEAGGFQKDQFINLAKSQVKWYGLHPSQDKLARSVSFWHSEAAKCNST